MNKVIKKRFDFYKNIFMVVTVLCVTNILSKQMNSLAQERQREEQREGIKKVNLRELESSNASDLYTQSQAHVQIKRLRGLIQETFSKKIVPHFDIISRMVT